MAQVHIPFVSCFKHFQAFQKCNLETGRKNGLCSYFKKIYFRNKRKKKLGTAVNCMVTMITENVKKIMRM